MKITNQIEDFYIFEDIFSNHELNIVSELYSKSDINSLWLNSIKHPGRSLINGHKLREESPIYLNNQRIINFLFKENSDILKLIRKSLIHNGHLNDSESQSPNCLPVDYTYVHRDPTTFSRINDRMGRVFKNITSYAATKFLKTSSNILGNKEWFVDITYNKADHGYAISSHIDARHRLLSGVIYLVDPPSDRAHEGSFLIHGSSISVQKEVPIKRNTGVFFLNDLKSYHSTSKFSNWGYSRDFICFSLANKSFSNLWQ